MTRRDPKDRDGVLDDISDEEGERLWSRGVPVTPERGPRPNSTQFTLRLPSDLFRDVAERAHALGKSTGELMRELMEEGLALRAEATPALAARVLARLLERMPDDVKRAAQTSDETASERRSAG